MSRNPRLYLGDIVAHEYFGLDRGIILDVVRHKVPEFLRALEPAAGTD